jgi:nitrite reductase (NO-forming)
MNKPSLIALTLVALALSSCGSGSSEKNSGGQSKPVISGEDVYKRTCIACHQANGQGVPGSFPPLAKSDYLANKENVIRQVIRGSSGDLEVNGVKYNNTMPPQPLSDEEVAAVLTYVYGNFGNSGGTVMPDEVKQVRSRQ